VTRFLFVIAAAVACSPGARVSPTTGGVRVDQARIGWGTKRVLTKQEPSTLIAQDGTICRVTPDRFKDTQVGRDTSCDWQPGNPPP
jgi:hypothetical protein